MPLPVALQTRLAKRGILKHLEPGERAKEQMPGLTDTLLLILPLDSQHGPTVHQAVEWGEGPQGR